MAVAEPPQTLTPETALLLGIDQLRLLAKGLQSRVVWQLLDHLGGPESLWQASGKTLEAGLAQWITPKKAREVAGAWAEKRPGIQCEQLAASYHTLGITVLSMREEAYPPLLSQIHDPPLLLYVRGNPQALSGGGRTLAFVGTRRLSDYGRSATETLIEGLAPLGPTIVSGLAEGIDGVAHSAALKHGLPTVAVLGTGIDTIFPSRHTKLAQAILQSGGALMSEYPIGTPGSRFTFPQRNRIIAGLCHGVVVVEGSIKSGSLITARCAMEEGRTVFAVPGSMFSPGSLGPHQLMREGATPVMNIEEMVADLRWLKEVPQQGQNIEQQALNLTQPNATPVQQPVDVSHIAGGEAILAQLGANPVAVDAIQAACNIAPEGFQQALTLLELEGVIRSLPGAKIQRVF